MIRIVQHVQLAKPVSQRLARRLVYRAAGASGRGVASGRTTSLLAGSNGSTLSPSSSSYSRTFSSSRPYATVLSSPETSSSSSSATAADIRDVGALSTPGASTSRINQPQISSAQTIGQTILVAPPSKEALEESGEEPVADSEARFQISERAAERLRTIALKENDPNVALRVAVESGGCHGYQYKIDLTNLSEGTGDYHFSLPKIAPSNVLIDPTSLSLLSGATLDFATELIGSTFRVTDNPHAAGGCGCGVSWEAKI